MTEVEGVNFLDEAAPVVQELVRLMKEEWGASHISTRAKMIRASIRHPREHKGNAAYGLFIVVESHHGAAIVRPPKRLKKDQERFVLSADQLDRAIHLGRVWRKEVLKIPSPISTQPTENKLVWPGGQTESNPRKF